jgi:16S rRNA G527 N7-methylase RsmG
MHRPDKENLYCKTCGEQFRTLHKLFRHIQKWNSKHNLRGSTLSR